MYSVGERSVNPLAYAFAGSNPALPMVFAKPKVVTGELDENFVRLPARSALFGRSQDVEPDVTSG